MPDDHDDADAPPGRDPEARGPRLGEAAAGEGAAIVRASWAGTAVFAATAGSAVALPDSALVPVSVVVALVLFAAGFATFAWAFLAAVGRSREDAISVADLFLLTGCAPAAVQRQLVGSLAVQVVVALATAAARPYTASAFGTLAPLYGVGLCGLWGARHGVFPPRAEGGGVRA